jgi:hypothetical protein
MWIVFFICTTIVLVTGIAIISDTNYKLRLKKMEEDSKTAKLALMYQILNARPELSLEDVKHYIESSDTDR